MSSLNLKAEVSVNDVTNADPVTDNEPVISADPLNGKAPPPPPPKLPVV